MSDVGSSSGAPRPLALPKPEHEDGRLVQRPTGKRPSGIRKTSLPFDSVLPQIRFAFAPVMLDSTQARPGRP
jgi:hypothetical protein